MNKINLINPEHYKQEGQECIDYIRDRLGYAGFKSYLLGQCHKYLYRFDYKHKHLDNLEKREGMRTDLKKAQWYLCRYISLMDYEINELNRQLEKDEDSPDMGERPSDTEL